MVQYDTYTSQRNIIIHGCSNMPQDGDEGYDDTHGKEDYSDFRQAAPSKYAHL